MIIIWLFIKLICNFASRMGIMDTYKIVLLSPQIIGKTFDYDIDDDFFASIDGLIQRGDIHSKVECLSAGSIMKFRIHSEGKVVVPCDRCLSDLDVRIETTDELNVKLGDDFSDDGECVVIPEAEGYIDLSHFIYEFIALSMPITCCHEPGKCDDAMMLELSKYQATRSGDEDDGANDSEYEKDSSLSVSEGEDSVEPVDSRWAILKQLKNK